MAKTIKLTNHGEGLIKYGKNPDALFKPGTTIEFPEEIGKKLLRLYSGQVRTGDGQVSAFVDDSAKRVSNKKKKEDAKEEEKIPHLSFESKIN